MSNLVAKHETEMRLILWGTAEALLSASVYVRHGQFSKEDKGGFDLYCAILNVLDERNGPLTIAKMLARAKLFHVTGGAGTALQEETAS